MALDHRAQKRTLADLETRGFTRRSDRGERRRHERGRRRTAIRKPAPAPVVVLPLLAFLALAALFLFRLGAGDPSRIPSALIGQPAPQTNLPPLAGLVRDGEPCPASTPRPSRAP